MKIDKQLEELGLTTQEVRVYLTLLKSEQSSLFELARRSKLNRSTTDSVIVKLKEVGLIRPVSIKKRVFYQASNPEKLGQMLEHKLRLYKHILPVLLKTANAAHKPVISLYEGSEGVRNIYLDNLNAKGELLTIAGESTFNDFIIKEYPQYIQERVAKKILLKLIVPDSERMRAWKKLDRNELRVTKLVTNNLYPLSINIDIYNDRVALTSFEHLIALVIEGQEIADSMRSIFYLLWENLRENDTGAKIYDPSATHY